MEFRLFCTKRYYTKLMQKLFKKKFKKVLELNGAKIEPEYSKKKERLNINGKCQKIWQDKE